MDTELSDGVKAQKDLLWGLFTDVRAHARHAEQLRANAVNVLLVISSALIALITKDGHVRSDEFALCLATVLIGGFGLAFAASYSELYVRNRRRAEEIRRVLDERFFIDASPSLDEVLERSDVVHERSTLYRWTRRMTGSTQSFWLLAPSLVIVAGVVLTFMAI